MDEDFEGYLMQVPEEKKFWCKNGEAISDLKQLANSLKKMDEEVYRFHANEDRNDFSSWVYDVIGDVKLAQNILKANDKEEASRKVKTRITYLKKKIASV